LTATVDLPTPPLPGDRDDVLGALEHRLVARRRQERGDDLGDHGDPLGAQRLDHLLDLDDQLAARGERIGMGRHVDPDHRVVALDLDAAHHPVGHDVVPEGRVDDLAQCLLDGCVGDHRRLPLG